MRNLFNIIYKGKQSVPTYFSIQPAGHNLGTQKIYSIKGFDKDAKQYTYNVNANTGVSSLNGTPFQVQIGLRYGF